MELGMVSKPVKWEQLSKVLSLIVVTEFGMVSVPVKP